MKLGQDPEVLYVRHDIMGVNENNIKTAKDLYFVTKKYEKAILNNQYTLEGYHKNGYLRYDFIHLVYDKKDELKLSSRMKRFLRRKIIEACRKNKYNFSDIELKSAYDINWDEK